MPASTPLILRKSRMRRRARTDLCGGRSVMIVPPATVIRRRTLERIGGFRRTRREIVQKSAWGKSSCTECGPAPEVVEGRFWITSHLPTTHQNLDGQITPRGQKIWAAPNTGQSRLLSDYSSAKNARWAD